MTSIDYRTFFPVREFPDRGIKWLLESPENVRGLVQLIVPDLVDSLDFSRSTKLPDTFIPDNLRKQESDLLYLVPYREGETEQEVLIYVLIEHQSTPDPAMGFRVLFYMLQIWDRQRRQWEDGKVPESQWRFRPILPIVFYTGAQKWETWLDMTALMDVPKALERFVPRHDTLFMNLDTKSDADLTSGDHPLGWLLRVVQKERASKAEFIQALTSTVERLAELPAEERYQWAKLMYYIVLLILHRREEGEREELIEFVTEAVHEHTLQEEVKKMGQTGAEWLMEQGEIRGERRGEIRGEKRGEERGEKRGELRAKRELLLKVVTTKFGSVSPAVSRKIKAIRSTRRLDSLLDKGLSANTIEEIGIE